MTSSLRVEDEMAFGLESLNLSAGEIRRRVGEGLESVGLKGFQRRRVTTLSGGELQRLLVASVISVRPRLLLTDDLLSNLDFDAAERLPILVSELAESSDCAWLDFSRRRSSYQATFTRELTLRWGRLSDSNSIDGNLRDEVPTTEHILTRARGALNAPGDGGVSEELASFIGANFAASGGSEGASGVESFAALGPLVELDNITFGYGRAGQLLRSATLAIPPGRLTMLVGANGSGKSTIGRLLAGMARPASGEIRVDGVPVGPRTLRTTTHFVLQDPEHHLLAGTPFDELALVGRHQMRSRIRREEGLRMVGLEDLEHTATDHLTRSQKRRLALALGVVIGAGCVVVDEPTNGQDWHQTCLVGRALRSVARLGTGILILTHDADFVYQFADAVIFLADGTTSKAYSVAEAFAAEDSPLHRRSALFTAWDAVRPDKGPGWVPRTLDELFGHLRLKVD